MMPTDEQVVALIAKAEKVVGEVKSTSLVGMWLFNGPGVVLLDLLEHVKDQAKGEGQ